MSVVIVLFVIFEYATLTKKRCFEDWCADTGTAFHMTDSLSCEKDVKPCPKNVKGISGVTCEVALSGTLELVFVSADNEFLVELKNVLYCPNLGFNLFSRKCRSIAVCPLCAILARSLCVVSST